MGLLKMNKWGFNQKFIVGITHRIHGADIYGNMDPINIPPMLVYIPYMDPMGIIISWFIIPLTIDISTISPSY